MEIEKKHHLKERANNNNKKTPKQKCEQTAACSTYHTGYVNACASEFECAIANSTTSNRNLFLFDANLSRAPCIRVGSSFFFVVVVSKSMNRQCSCRIKSESVESIFSFCVRVQWKPTATVNAIDVPFCNPDR